jgi:hypothetical protein
MALSMQPKPADSQTRLFLPLLDNALSRRQQKIRTMWHYSRCAYFMIKKFLTSIFFVAKSFVAVQNT